jgi:hypothetical protein
MQTTGAGAAAVGLFSSVGCHMDVWGAPVADRNNLSSLIEQSGRFDGRVRTVSAMCEVKLKDWTKRNSIELVNFREPWYGTHEYQHHLNLIGSRLNLRRGKIPLTP